MKTTQAFLAFGLFASALAQQSSESTTITKSLSEALKPSSLTAKATPTTTVTKSGDATVTGTKTSHTSSHGSSSSSGGVGPTAAAANLAPLLGVAVALMAV